MPYSMTGFSTVKKSFDGYDIDIKLKSLNNKGIDISIKGDKNTLTYLDIEIRKIIQNYFERGTFQVYINIIKTKIEFPIDSNILSDYVKTIRNITSEAGLNVSDDKIYDISITLILNNDNNQDFPDTLKESILNTLKEALDLLKIERKKEGIFLVEDIKNRLKIIEENLAIIESKKEVIIESLKEKISSKLKQLLGENYSERAFIEATLLADKLDITEEIVRLKAHISRFKELLKLDQPIGRQLDFLCQEMHREINTLGNKMPDFSQYTVEMKTQLEKIRQQVQNIE